MEAEFERKRREAEELAETKTAKNCAKRQKRKERTKTKTKGATGDDAAESRHVGDGALEETEACPGQRVSISATRRG